jgi:hypothetical protein
MRDFRCLSRQPDRVEDGFRVISLQNCLIPGIFPRGDRFGRTASATRKSAQIDVISHAAGYHDIHWPRVSRVELDPLYVDVIVRRYEAATGNHAILVETGETLDLLAAFRTWRAATAA